MKLEGKKVAVLATNGFQQDELFSPYDMMSQEGAKVHIISDQQSEIRGWSKGGWGRSIMVNKSLDEISVDDYDGLMIPGGLMSPDKLRTNRAALNCVREFFAQGKPVGAICHAPWILINADVVKGRKMTSYPSIRMDLENAGAEWMDKTVVVDNGLVTSRSPADLEAFNEKLVEEICEGVHEEQMASV